MGEFDIERSARAREDRAGSDNSVAPARRRTLAGIAALWRSGKRRTQTSDDAGAAWLRTGADNASWLPRLRANPAVDLERGGATRAFGAAVVEDAATVARIDELTLAKYGWSEQLLRAMSGAGRRQVAIRLDPR